jgi:predicted amidophosphoribosyltransferase
MSCPTCDHTMHGIARWFWCPRCGTTLSKNNEKGTVSIPSGVGQMRNWYHNPTYIPVIALRNQVGLYFHRPEERDKEGQACEGET